MARRALVVSYEELVLEELTRLMHLYGWCYRRDFGVPLRLAPRYAYQAIVRAHWHYWRIRAAMRLFHWLRP